MTKVSVIVLTAFGLIIGAWVYFPVWFGLEGIETTQQPDFTAQQVKAQASDPTQYAEPKVENWNELKQEELVAQQTRSTKPKFRTRRKSRRIAKRRVSKRIRRAKRRRSAR